MRMIITDFDGTLADTFQKSPRGIGVEEAYSLAVKEVFGEEGTEAYQQIGGLQNKAPEELIRELLKILRIPADSSDKLTKKLVSKKLQVILKEIGPEWPRFFEGVPKFFERCLETKMKILLLTSGHRVFIKKTFCAWGIQCPDMITWENLDEAGGLAKPDPRIMDLVWQKIPDCTPLIYVGDDPVKDGQFAQGIGVNFGWFNPSGKKSPTLLPPSTFEFQRWQDFLMALNI